jgi:hypothetical protein
MASNEIAIAKHLEKFEKVLNNTGVPTLAIMSCISDIIMEIRLSLMSQENIAIKDNQTPILECNSAEIQIWAMAILTSAWTAWCFTSKANNPDYQNHPDKFEASTNVNVALPYIMASIEDAMTIGGEIGTCKKTKYRPENLHARIQLRKL